MEETVEKKQPIKDMTVELIRDELRDVKFFTRKIQRDRKLNKNRSALGQLTVNVAYTEEFVTETAKSLRKKTLNIQDYRKLQAALIQSEDHINAFFKVDNAIQGLSRDLSGRSTQSKLAAANCCCNLSLGNSKACVVLSKFVGPYLVAELESTNQPLAEVCAWTIGNLTCESEKAFSILHAQGCMKSLINLARQSSDALLPAASYALLRYMYTGFNLIEETDIIHVGEILAARYPRVSDIDTMWLLALLSSECKNIDFLIKCTPAVCDFLIETSEEEVEDIEKFSAALRIIANVVTEPTGQVATHLFNNEFFENRTFVDNLLTHEYFHIRNETLWLIGNLYNHPVDTVREKVKMIVYSLRTDVKGAIHSFKELTCEAAPLVQEQISLNSQ